MRKRIFTLLIIAALLISVVFQYAEPVMAQSSLPERYTGSDDPNWIYGGTAAPLNINKWNLIGYQLGTNCSVGIGADSQTMFLCKINPSATSYNLGTFTFTNCGTVMGGQTKVVVQVTSVTFGKRHKNTNYYDDDYVVFCQAKKGGFSIGAGSTDTGGENLYGGNMNVTCSVTVYPEILDSYGNGTGRYSTVPMNFPFAALFQDIDQTNPINVGGKVVHTVTEGVTLNVTEWDEYWRWNSFCLNTSDYTFSAPGDPSLNTTYPDNITKTGFVAVSKSNLSTFTVTFREGTGMATGLLPYKIYNGGRFRIRKRSEQPAITNNRPYSFAGIEYTLYDSAGQVVGRPIALYDSGESAWIDMNAGNYTLRETKTNGWYKQSSASYPVTVTRGVMNTEVVVSDSPKLGNIYLKKAIAPTEGSILPEGTDYLTDKEHDYANPLKFTLTSVDKPGETYEIALGSSYDFLSGETTKLTGDPLGIKFTNFPYGRYTLSEDAESLAAAEARVHDTTGDFDISLSLRDINIALGDTTTYKVDGENVSAYTNYWDTKPEYRLKIIKEPIGGDKKDGWKFEVYDNESCSGEPVGQMTDINGNLQPEGTDANGVVYISGLPGAGKYYVLETTKRKPYTADVNPKEVSVAKSPQNTVNVNGVAISTTVVPFINNRNYIDIKVVKEEIKNNGRPGWNVGGVVFTLYDSNHTAIATETSSLNGEVIFSGTRYNITDGEYVLEETSFDDSKYIPSYTVPGYDKPSRRIILEGDEGIYYSTDPECGTTFTNIEKPTPGVFAVSLQKLSTEPKSAMLEDYSFEGIEYGVYADENCAELLSTITLNESGAGFTSFETEEEIDSMTVWIREISTSGNYKLSSEVFERTVVSGEVLEIQAMDEPESANLSFRKEILCEDDNADVPDASKLRFTLINRDNPSVSFTETVRNGLVSFSGIPIGRYLLLEEGLTDYTGGYMLDSTGPVEITLVKGNNTLGTAGNKWINYWVQDELPGGIDVAKSTNNGFITDYSEFHITITDVTHNKVVANNRPFEKNGTFTLGNLAPGTYKIHENLTAAQRKLYEQPEDQLVTISEGDTAHKMITVKNKLKTTTIKVIKKSSDNKVGAIEFRLYGTAVDGQEIGGQSVTTRKEVIDGETVGTAVFTNVKAGNYVVAETGYDARYYSSNHRVDGYDVPAQSVVSDGENEETVTFINTPFRFRLIKTEALENGELTDTPIANAGYTLFKLDPENPPQTEEEIGQSESLSFRTDENGVIDTNEVKRGTWMVFETSPPEGYLMDTSVPSNYPIEGVTESSRGHYVGTITLDDDHTMQPLTDTNQRKAATVYLNKEDDKGNPVGGAVFGLFTDPECENLAKNLDGTEMQVTTDDFGTITRDDGKSFFSNLAWGTYYLKEIKAPRGYIKNTTVYRIDANQYNTEITVSTQGSAFVNERAKGKVKLIKRSATDDSLLNGAHFALYTSAGDLVKEGLVTGADNNEDGIPDGTGCILVEGLGWGEYYFKETQAPATYVLESEYTRFTVNAYSATNEPQEVVAIPNQKAKASITITIKMKADDYWKDHGSPTFFAVVKNTNNSNIEYRRPYTFDEEFVKNHIDGDGYVSKSVTFNIPADSYNAYSIKADRYELDASYPGGPINSIQKGTLGANNDVDFNIGPNEAGAATFVYAKKDWSKYGDQTAKTNIIKKSRVYTGLSVEYLGDSDNISGNLPFTKDLLSVHALFDDGTTKELTDTEYTVTDPYNDNAELTRFPKQPGVYTYNVAATIKGTTRYGTFTVNVKEWKKVKLYFHTNGGGSIRGKTDTENCPIDGDMSDYISVWQFQPLTTAEPNPANYTPAEKTGYDFAGWYLDAGFTRPFDPTAEISKNMHVFAKWTVKTYKVNYFGAAPDASVTVSNVPEQQTKTYNQSVTLTDQVPTINKGYDFLGWSTSQGGRTEADVEYTPGETYTANANLNLYAVWKPHTATLTYNANGGSLGDVPARVTMSYDTATYAYSDARPEKESYTFAGWNTRANGSGESFAPGSIYKAAYKEPENGTLYAMYIDGIAPVAGKITMTTGNVVNLSATDGVGVTAYYFGTSDSPSAISYTSITPTTSMNITKNVNEAGTYYFFAKDAAGNVSSAKSINIQEFKLIFYEDGNALAAEENESGTADLTMNGGTEVVTGCKGYSKFWAVGTAYKVENPRVAPGNTGDIIYSGIHSGGGGLTGTVGMSGTRVGLDFTSTAFLTYDPNLGTMEELTASNMPNNTALKYSRAAVIPNKVPVRTGFEFEGWNTKQDGSGTGYDPGDQYAPANSVKTSATLYAQWSQLHLGSDDLSWDDVETIGNAGVAAEFFSEDFTAVKNDLADDGDLTSATKSAYTKEVNIGGSNVHAMIADFDHDELTAGGTAAITFITLESIGEAPMEEEGKTINSWESSTMRRTTLAQYLLGSAEELKDVIRKVNKKSVNAAGSTQITSDAFFLPSAEELYGAYAYNAKP